MNIYVANIAHEATEDDIRQAFNPFGTVSNVALIKDKFTGLSRGFAFVEMPSKQEAQKAMDTLNGQDLKGRPLAVNEARPKADSHRNSSHRSGGYNQGRRDRW